MPLTKSRERWLKVVVAVVPVLAFLFVGSSWPEGRFSASKTLANQGAAAPRGAGDWLVVPGRRVGAIALHQAADSIFDLFPKPSIGSYTEPGDVGSRCGTDYTIGLLQDGKHPGFLRVFAKDDKIVGIEAAGARYHMEQGIATNSPPEDVRREYNGMKSYLFLHCCDESLNGGPLVLWTNTEKGIAFSFAYPARGDRRFRVSTFLVFDPGAVFCEQGSVFPDPDSWRELRPYSLGSASGDKQAILGGLPTRSVGF